MVARACRFCGLLLGVWLVPLVNVAFAAGDGSDLPFFPLTTLWALISFVLVLYILTKKAFPPIVAALDRRAADIREGLEAADRARAEAAEMIRQHEDQLAKARAEGSEIIEEAKRDATKVRDSIIEGAKQEASEISARTVREIEQAKTKAIDELQQRAATLGVEIAARLIKKELKAEDHKDLINERIQSLAG